MSNSILPSTVYCEYTKENETAEKGITLRSASGQGTSGFSHVGKMTKELASGQYRTRGLESEE
jgi:lysyl-tRNA synthetase class I